MSCIMGCLEEELDDALNKCSEDLAASEKILDKIETIFGKISGYDTTEETRDEFLVRFAEALVYESELSQDVGNILFRDYIIPAYQKIPNLPKYHCVIDGEHVSCSVRFTRETKHVSLHFSIEPKHNYIFWTDDLKPLHKDSHGIDYNFTPQNVENWLRWLIND